jgi:hypothetical protein
MENPNANNSDGSASSTVNDPNSNLRDEIGIAEVSVPVLEQITGDDAAPVPFVQQVAIDEKLAKENLVSSGEVRGGDGISNPNVAVDFDEVHDADEGLLVSDELFDADDEPLRPTSRQESMRTTDPTAEMQSSTTRSDIPSSDTTADVHHLIEAYLVEEDDEIPIYDAIQELPSWWRERRFKILIPIICILLIAGAALLAVFLGGNPSSSISSETTTSLIPSSSPVSTPVPTTSLFPTLSPHTSAKVSLVVFLNYCCIMNTEEDFSSKLQPT